ncbi:MULTISPECIES: BrxA family protein [unclassified Thiocapsa]|uniref:BrxA family protein n=1 Tax=unclassified Thiocapsa TaxID=2641286 RepID=UPI0035B45713
MEARSKVASCAAIKGSLIEETYAVFRGWDYAASKTDNLKRARQENTIGAKSASWAQNVSWAVSRRFDPAGRDRPLVELAKSGGDREVWKPLLLYHLTRDEFLVRDFLVNWLYPQFTAGAYRMRAADVMPYLQGLTKKKGIDWSGHWSESTSERVASGLLRIAADFGLLQGLQAREFASYHLPEQSFLYLLHVMMEREVNARRVIDADDWRMYLMAPSDVERELLRLHQFRKLHFEVAGSLAQLKLPAASAADYAKELC